MSAVRHTEPDRDGDGDVGSVHALMIMAAAGFAIWFAWRLLQVMGG